MDTPIQETVEVVENDTQVEETTETPSFLDTFEYQYNKEPSKVTDEAELKELVEMGRYYKENGKSKLEGYKSNSAYKWVDEYMKTNGFEDSDKFVEAIKSNQEQDAINKTAKGYVDKGLSQDVALKLAEQEHQIKNLDSKLKTADTKTAKEKEYTDFIGWYEDKMGKPLKADDIPKEVWTAVENGTPLKYAFMEYDYANVKTRAEQETIQNLEDNAQSSTGSVQEGTSSTTNEWTQESVIAKIDSMSKTQGAKWVSENLSILEKVGLA